MKEVNVHITGCNSERHSLLVFILQVNRNVHCFMTDSS